MNEAELAAQTQLAASGDADALQRLLVHYHAMLHGKVASILNPALNRRLDPDDVLQQAYVSAFKALKLSAFSSQPSASSAEPADSANPSPKRERGPSSPNRDRRGAASDPNHDRERAASDPNRDRKGAASVPNHDRRGAVTFDTPAGFYKWLERIALNELKNAQRDLQRHKRDVRREIPATADARTSYPDLFHRLAATDTTPSGHVAQGEAAAAVLSCLARLTDDQRAVVRLRFLEARPVPEVAAALGKTDEAIHALCYRALKDCRTLLVSLSRYLTHL